MDYFVLLHAQSFHVDGRSAKKQESLDVDVKKLQESIFDDLGDVKTDVFQENKKLTDDIDNVEPVAGAPGPPGNEGPPGLYGKNGIHGETGQQGQRGKRGIAGPPGRSGVTVHLSDLKSSASLSPAMLVCAIQT